MAQPQKFISLVNGRLQEGAVESVDASTGAPDADKLVRLKQRRQTERDRFARRPGG